MAKGIELANELRKLADAVEGLEEVQRPNIYFCYLYGQDERKQEFINFAKVLPKPFEKQFSDSELNLIYDSNAIWVKAYIERNKVCKIVTPAIPAVYDCEPLLTAEEIDSFESPEDEVPF
jgi:hypothetical protein